MTPNIDTVTNNTVYNMSVNIQSVIDNTTWYIAIEVINSVGRDRTEFTNLTEFISKQYYSNKLSMFSIYSKVWYISSEQST